MGGGSVRGDVGRRRRDGGQSGGYNRGEPLLLALHML